jgi:Baseplate J-like protein
VGVCYLEVDDEITSAISQIRAVTDGEAIIVVPPGSRIATSRINFKLLAREAAVRRMNVVAVSDEPQVRALAISAGLPAYDSIVTAQGALATFREQDRRLAERIGPTMPRDHPDPALRGDRGTETLVLPGASVSGQAGSESRVAQETSVMPASLASGAAGAASAAATAGTANAAARRKRSRRRVPLAPVLVLVLLLLLVAGVGYGAYTFLPTASITIHPQAAQIQTPAFTVTADPNVAVTDPDAGVIPAQVITVPVHVQGEFPATGVDAHDIRAVGSVRFKSENTLNAVPIAADTIVSTVDGVDFATMADVTLPKASFATGPTQVDVDVRAVKTGTRGNVDAGTITLVPAALASQLITVTNPNPTTGGKHVEEQVISQEDYDAALAALNGQLQAGLATTLANPGSVPRGLQVFAATAQLGDIQADQPATALVGSVAPSFSLALDTTAQVTAVNESLIDDVATARLRGLLRPGQKLVGDDPTAAHDVGTVVGKTVVFNVIARALGYTDPDLQKLVAAIRGKSIVDARVALAQFGAADVSVWPDFIDHLPDQNARISVIVVPPSAPAPTLSPSPSRSPSPTPSPSRTPSLVPSVTPSAPPPTSAPSVMP